MFISHKSHYLALKFWGVNLKWTTLLNALTIMLYSSAIFHYIQIITACVFIGVKYIKVESMKNDD